MKNMRLIIPAFFVLLNMICSAAISEDRKESAEPAPKAFIDGVGPGWVTLTEKDFADVNGDPETWSWDGEMVKTTGVPVGVYKTKKEFTNFELVVQWRHMQFGGNSGVWRHRLHGRLQGA